MVTKAVGALHAMVVLKSLVVLSLGGMLVLSVLIVIEQVDSSPATIHPGTVALLMALGIHAGRLGLTVAASEGRGGIMGAEQIGWSYCVSAVLRRE